MTINLETQIKSRFEHTNAKRALQEKYQAKMLFAHAEGMWKAGPELISVLQACITEEAVILDLYDNPIRVNVSELQSLAFSRWQEQMNAWESEYLELKKKR